MNLRQLELFSLVAELGNVTEASRQLYMTQPAVSQTIADLEDSLGLKLFDRINRRMHLTFAGEVLYKYSKKILSLVEEAEGHMLEITNNRIGRLRLGASTTIGIYLLPMLMGQFKQQYHAIQSTFVIDNTCIVEEMLLDNRLDIGFVEGLVHSSEIVVQKVKDDELWLICSPRHHWITAGKTIIAPEEIEGQALILREQGSGTREVVEKVLQEHGVDYHPWHVLNNTEAIKRAVMEDMGIAFVSQLAVKEEIDCGRLAKVKIKGIPISREFRLIWHKDKYHTPLMNSFIDLTMRLAE